MNNQEANQAFIRLHNGLQARLTRGLADRRRIVEALARGETPEGPRVDWIRNTAVAVMTLLGQKAHDYNQANPGDRCSCTDLEDCINYCLELMAGQD